MLCTSSVSCSLKIMTSPIRTTRIRMISPQHLQRLLPLRIFVSVRFSFLSVLSIVPFFSLHIQKHPFTLHRIYCSTLSCFSVERHKSRNHDNCHNDNKHHDHRHQKFCGCSLSKNTCFSLRSSHASVDSSSISAICLLPFWRFWMSSVANVLYFA